jgi:hypothetical protein
MKFLKSAIYAASLWCIGFSLSGISAPAFAKPAWETEPPENPAPQNPTIFPWIPDEDLYPNSNPRLDPRLPTLDPSLLPQPEPYVEQPLHCYEIIMFGRLITICIYPSDVPKLVPWWLPQYLPNIPTWVPDPTEWVPDWMLRSATKGQDASAEAREGPRTSNVSFSMHNCGPWYVGENGHWAHAKAVAKRWEEVGPRGERIIRRQFIGVEMTFPLAENTVEMVGEALQDVPTLYQHSTLVYRNCVNSLR